MVQRENANGICGKTNTRETASIPGGGCKYAGGNVGHLVRPGDCRAVILPHMKVRATPQANLRIRKEQIAPARGVVTVVEVSVCGGGVNWRHAPQSAAATGAWLSTTVG